MDILIPDKWLREFLKTSATPKQIAQNLSLCGPSVERIDEIDGESVYEIEVTTNRIDTASVYGIAREAAAILPEFKIKALFKPIKSTKKKFSTKVKYLKVKVNPKLCVRFSAVLIKNVRVKPSTEIIQKRLNQVGIRSINNVVDISNYLMIEMGQPVHTFDWDKIEDSKMTVRESQSGETITTLDGKKHELPGGDIVIQDGSGKLIDLAGIMGGQSSSVDNNTKNVLLFVQTYEPVHIRRTSMKLAHRTQAAGLFEKGLDPELVTPTIMRGIEMFEKYTEGKAEAEILDIYPNSYKSKRISLEHEFINKYLGANVSKENIVRMLSSLGFEVGWKKETLFVSIPSWRAQDIEISQDVIEEVARIYGYHNLPSKIMNGDLPINNLATPFKFESKVKQILKGHGGAEVYTLSLVSKNETDSSALRIKNPLGTDSEYLRTSLMPSLVKASSENTFEKNPFHLFEIANVYIPRKNDLPNEVTTLAGIFENTSFREAKGIVESLLSELNIKSKSETEDSKFFSPSKRLTYKVGSEKIGQFGVLEKGQIYYEFGIEKLKSHSSEISKFQELSKYPPQIEDITFELPEKTKIGDTIQSIKQIEFISEVYLSDIYKNSYTFRVHYQNPDKTLEDVEVNDLREKIINLVKNKFGGSQKD